MPLFPTFASKDKFAPTQPVFPNLSPSEELHELKRATQVGSSVAGSEVFGQDGNGQNFSDEFRLNDEEQQQQDDRKTPTMETSADQNTQNDLKKILERMDELEKKNEQMANINAEQLAKVQNEISEIGKWVKQQQKEKEQKEKEQMKKEQREKALLKFRMNFWDPNACHGDIEIVGNDRLTVRRKGNNDYFRSVFAKHPISLNKASDGIFYFEISIKQKKNYLLSFGFAFKQLDKLATSIRGNSGTYAWESDGQFWINGSGKGPNAKYSFGEGDIVGIGVKLANRQMFFTKNRLRLDSPAGFSLLANLDDLFPFVTLGSGDEIEANIGPNFAFDLATL